MEKEAAPIYHMSTAPRVSIITVNYNGLELTLELLRSIRANSFTDVEVMVVDNASEVSPRAAIETQFPGTTVIESAENLGFAGGNNLGIAAARGDYHFFINNDAELTDGCLETLLAVYDAHPDVGAVSPLLCYFQEDAKLPGGYDRIQYAGTTRVHPLTARNRTVGAHEADRGQYDTPGQPTAYAHGAAMLVPAALVKRTGGMPENFFLYYEELDWCAQFARLGYQNYVAPRAKVYHKESYAVSKISTLKSYYLTRNRILFMRRNYPALSVAGFWLFLLVFTVPKTVLTHLRNGEPEQIGAFFRGIGWHFAHLRLPAPATAASPPALTVSRTR